MPGLASQQNSNVPLKCQSQKQCCIRGTYLSQHVIDIVTSLSFRSSKAVNNYRFQAMYLRNKCELVDNFILEL